MKRRNKIGIAVIVAVLIALAIVWETVPYVRYLLIPVTGGTQAPKQLLWNDSPPPRYSREYAAHRRQIPPADFGEHARPA